MQKPDCGYYSVKFCIGVFHDEMKLRSSGPCLSAIFTSHICINYPHPSNMDVCHFSHFRLFAKSVYIFAFCQTFHSHSFALKLRCAKRIHCVCFYKSGPVLIYFQWVTQHSEQNFMFRPMYMQVMFRPDISSISQSKSRLVGLSALFDHTIRSYRKRLALTICLLRR